MTEEVRVLSLFSHDGADDEDDYFLCAKKAEAEELYLSLTFVIGCGQKAREHRIIELALGQRMSLPDNAQTLLYCGYVPISWYWSQWKLNEQLNFDSRPLYRSNYGLNCSGKKWREVNSYRSTRERKIGSERGGHLWFYRIRSKISSIIESTIFTSTMFCSTLFLLYRISSTIIVSTDICSK